MREVHTSDITSAVAKLVVHANCRLPGSVHRALTQSLQTETAPLGRDIIEQLLENTRIAEEENMPICQDTGLTVIFADIGQDVHLVGEDFEAAINKGVAQGYTEGFLRKSSVAEPLFERKNTQDNTPAILHTRIVPGDRVTLLVAPKGAGSENKGALAMLTPADGIEGVKRFVVETIRKAGASPCPPMVVGVGIGGNMEVACLLAKRGAARSPGTQNADPRYAALEADLLEGINKTGIGPQGLGGNTTALAVNVEFSATHIASLPVAVNINCHASRHANVVI